jgi:hypothetical protein
MSKETEGYKNLDDVVVQIKEDMERLLANPIQIGVVDKDSNIKYIDDELEEKYGDFISSFVKGNFDLLSNGEHSLPLSGVNVGFFKISDLSLIVLYSESGPVGQLLAFKGKMGKYTEDINKFILEEAKPKKEKKIEKTAYRVPIKQDGLEKKKFSMIEAKVIHLIDGKNTIEAICEKTNLPRLKVDEIIKKYQKKGWVKLKRVIITDREFEEEEKAEAETVRKPKPLIKKEPIKPEIKEKEEVKTPQISPKVPDIIAENPTVDEVYTDIDGLLEVTDPISSNISSVPKPNVSTTSQPPKAIPQEIPQAIPEAIPQEIPEAIPQEIPEAIPQKIPEKSQKIPQQIQEAKLIAAPVPSQNQISPPKPKATEQKIEVTVAEEVNEEMFDDLMNLMGETKPIDQAADNPEVIEESSLKADDLLKAETPVQAQKPKPSAIPIAEPITKEDEITIEEQPRIPKMPTKPVPKAETVPDTIKPLDETLSKLNDVLAKTERERTETTEIAESVSQEEEAASLEDYIKLKDNIEISEKEEKPTKPTIIGAKAVCPHCKSVVFMMEKICPECKKPLKTCPHCNAPITLFARICPECGSIL